MADHEIAAKAPENDAMEDQSLDTPITATAPSTTNFPATSTPAAAAATAEEPQPGGPTTLGEHCLTDRPILPGQQSTGEMIKYDDIETYISKPADYPTTPGKLLLFLTNARGVHSINNQLQADLFAQQGFVVVMPDLFRGDALPRTVTTEEEDPNASWLDTIKARVVETSKSFVIDMWLARHTPEKVMPTIDKIINQVKDEFADAISHGGGIYAVGYCFGGKYVLVLAGERSDSVMQGQAATEQDVEAGMKKVGPHIKCGVLAHGTLVTREDLKNVKVPVSLVCVENDPLFPEEILEFGKKELSTNNVEHEFQTYPGAPHGFAVVGEYDSATIKDAQKNAFAQMSEWLKRY